VIPLFKGVKAEDMDNYRPISILSGTPSSPDENEVKNRSSISTCAIKACMHIEFMKDILDFLVLHSDSLNYQT
jgi:hypothetical protein